MTELCTDLDLEPASAVAVAPAWLKLALLSEGISPTPAFLDWFAQSQGYVRRRNFYNSPNWGGAEESVIPQEIRLASETPVVVAVNNYGQSRWRLSHSGQVGVHILDTGTGQVHPVQLLRDLTAFQDDPDVALVCNLYGGSALSFFSPRACYFFAEGTECRFCSLAGTADEADEYANRLRPHEVRDAVAKVAAADDAALTQIMIVGGNERNLDRGFVNQAALVHAASDALAEAGLVDRVSVHLIAMPPNDLSLVEKLGEVPNVHAGFNLEVWAPDRFEQIAPGKAKDYGQGRILAALEQLREVVGPYRAHSILIAGLEDAQSTLAGARWMAERGISPIVNSYHSDRHSVLGLSVRPTYEVLTEVASGLQHLHDSFPIQPYWKGCGRNAMDYEAANGLFRGTPAAL